MGSFIWNTLFFLLALGILVTVHEWGHFWVARRCGVKVERFSIGFGKTLWTRRGADGTEYALSMIPLGGYVKMLDERVESVPTHLQESAFNNKSVGQRSAIVAAGPMANFILAILAFWLMFVIGVPSLRPIMGEPIPESIAAVSGLSADLEIVSVNDELTEDWEAVNLALVRHLGDSSITLGARYTQGEEPQSYILDTREWKLDREQPSPLAGLGLAPYQPNLYLEVAQVLENSAAQRGELIIGDKLLSLDGEKLQNWQRFVEIIQANANHELKLDVERDGHFLSLFVTPEGRDVDGSLIGYMGIAPRVDPLPDSHRLTLKYGPIDALGESLERSWRLIKLTLVMLGKLVTGRVSLDNLSGPVAIAQGAGATAHYGFVYFLGFVALISINLGIINLFPLPVLDGGHLVFFAIEKVTGRPVSEKVQAVGFRIGTALLVALMAVALFNDLMRL